MRLRFFRISMRHTDLRCFVSINNRSEDAFMVGGIVLALLVIAVVSIMWIRMRKDSMIEEDVRKDRQEANTIGASEVKCV